VLRTPAPTRQNGTESQGTFLFCCRMVNKFEENAVLNSSFMSALPIFIWYTTRSVHTKALWMKLVTLGISELKTISSRITLERIGLKIVILVPIPSVPSSNLGSETGSSDCYLAPFFLHKSALQCLKLCAGLFPSYDFQFDVQ
jgi:hypothetical protein